MNEVGSVSARGWSRKFEIVTPDGTRLNTLREAVAYLEDRPQIRARHAGDHDA